MTVYADVLADLFTKSDAVEAAIEAMIPVALGMADADERARIEAMISARTDAALAKYVQPKGPQLLMEGTPPAPDAQA